MVIAGGMGGVPVLPVVSLDGQELRYPVGVADVEQLTGRPFNEELYRSIPQFLYQGALDNNDIVQYPDDFNDVDRELITRVLGDQPVSRWNVCQAVVTAAAPNVVMHLDPYSAHETGQETGKTIISFIQAGLSNSEVE